MPPSSPATGHEPCHAGSAVCRLDNGICSAGTRDNRRSAQPRSPALQDRAAHGGEVTTRGRVQLPVFLRVELSLDPGPGAGCRRQRFRVDDLVGPLPDLREVLHERRLLGQVRRTLPEDDRLVHPTPSGAQNRSRSQQNLRGARVRDRLLAQPAFDVGVGRRLAVATLARKCGSRPGRCPAGGTQRPSHHGRRGLAGRSAQTTPNKRPYRTALAKKKSSR
jgi:hypothetical protein